MKQKIRQREQRSCGMILSQGDRVLEDTTALCNLQVNDSGKIELDYVMTDMQVLNLPIS